MPSVRLHDERNQRQIALSQEPGGEDLFPLGSVAHVEYYRRGLILRARHGLVNIADSSPANALSESM